MGMSGYMQGSEHSDRQGLGEIAEMLVKRNTEELEIASTCSLLFTLQADESVEKNLPTFPKLL